MEYTSRNAILQSALLLADTTTEKGGVSEYVKGSNPRALQIVQQAVREVIGFKSQATLDKEADAKIRWHRLEILVVLLLKALQQNTGSCRTDEFESVTYGSPGVSWSLLFDLVKSCDLWLEYFLVLPTMTDDVAVKLLSEAVRYLDTNPDQTDMECLRQVIDYVGLTANSPIYKSTETRISEPLNGPRSSMSKSVHLTTKSSSSEDEDLSSALVTFWRETNRLLYSLRNATRSRDTSQDEESQAVATLLQAIFTAVSHDEYFEELKDTKVSLLAIVTNLVYSKGFAVCSTAAPLQGLDVLKGGSTGHHPIAMLLSYARSGTSDSDKGIIGNLVDEATEDELPNVEVYTLLPEEVKGELIVYGVRTLEKFLEKSVISEDIKCLNNMPIWKYLQGPTQRADTWLWQRTGSNFMKLHHKLLTDEENLQKCPEILSQYMQTYPETMQQKGLLSEEASKRVLTSAVACLKLRLRGWSDSLKTLLQTRSTAFVEDPRWLTALEDNVRYMTEPTILVTAVDTLAWLSGKDDINTECLARYREVLLKAFSGCSLEVRNNCLGSLSETYSSQDLHEIFGAPDLKDNVRGALNRITSNDGIQKLPELARICLQAPELVVKEMVDTTTHNKGQIQAVVKVIHQLPALTKFGSYHNSAVVLIINALSALRRRDARIIASQEEQNLMQLSKELMQPHSGHSPVINPARFLHDFILPNVVSSKKAPGPTVVSQMWCRLMLVAIDVLAQLDSDWLGLITESEPVVLLYIIYNNLDHLITARADNIEPKYAQLLQGLRDDWLSCMEHMRTIFSKFPDIATETELLWLRKRLEGCHWTIQWLCHDMCHSFPLLTKLPLPVPRPISTLVDQSDRQLYFVDANNSDVLLSLLEFVQVSDTTLDIVKHHLKQEAVGLFDPLIPRTVLCLAMILSQSTSQEWHRLAGCIQLVLDVKQQENHHVSDVLEIFLQALWVLYKHESLKETSAVSWREIASSLSWMTVITLLGDRTDLDLGDLCHCLLLFCSFVARWPDQEFGYHLLPLGLDIVSKLKVFLSPEHQPTDDTYSEVEQAEVFEAARKWVTSLPLQDLRCPLMKALSVDSHLQEEIVDTQNV